MRFYVLSKFTTGSEVASSILLELANLLDHEAAWPKPMASDGWPQGWAIGLHGPNPLASHAWLWLANLLGH